MMKLLLTYLLGMATWVSAQPIDRAVISSGGEPLSNGDIHLNFTIGESLIGVITNDVTLDQGFWAESLTVEPITEENHLNGIVVYPNPVDEQLTIYADNNAVYGITLFAVDGKMTLKKKVDEDLLTHTIDTSHLAKGMYVLSLFIEGENQEKLFKVIKN